MIPRAGSMATDGAAASRAIHSTAPAPRSERAQVCPGARNGAQLFAKLARAKEELRPIGVDEALEPVVGERRIDQRGRVTGRGRREQAEQGLGAGAAEQKDEPLSRRGDFARELEARGAKLGAREPRVAAIVVNGALGLDGPDQRQQSAAGMVQFVHCNGGRGRLTGACSIPLIR